MEPLICPQCGGQVDESSADGEIARCEYCNTKFHVARPANAEQWNIPVASANYSKVSRKSVANANIAIILLVAAAFAGFIFYMISSVRTKTNQTIDQSQDAANSAKAAANAIRQAANAMANVQRAVNAATEPRRTPELDSH